MTVKEILTTKRTAIFLAVKPDGTLVAICPAGLKAFEEEMKEMLTEHPGFLDWIVVPDDAAFRNTHIIWKLVGNGVWMNPSGQTRSGHLMDNLLPATTPA